MSEAKKESTVVATRPVNETLATISESPWGASGTSKADLILPRLLLMQALSDKVTKGAATPGDIIESINGDIIAKKGAGCEVIPFFTYKEWIRSKLVDNSWQYLGRVPETKDNKDWPYETTIEGVPHRNDACINFFVLVCGNIGDFPFLLSFKRSSYYAGRKLSTHFQLSGMKNRPPAGTVFKLSSQQVSMDKHTFFAYDVSKVRESTKEELSIAFEWWKTLSQKEEVKVDESEEAVPF